MTPEDILRKRREAAMAQRPADDPDVVTVENPAAVSCNTALFVFVVGAKSDNMRRNSVGFWGIGCLQLLLFCVLCILFQLPEFVQISRCISLAFVPEIVSLPRSRFRAGTARTAVVVAAALVPPPALSKSKRR